MIEMGHNEETENLLSVIKRIHVLHSKGTDDTCWMDLDIVFQAAGLPVPERPVGCKEAMYRNCKRFIDVKCSGGTWKSYEELETEIVRLRNFVLAFREAEFIREHHRLPHERQWETEDEERMRERGNMERRKKWDEETKKLLGEDT